MPTQNGSTTTIENQATRSPAEDMGQCLATIGKSGYFETETWYTPPEGFGPLFST
jgi:hypothetical protein